MKLPKRYFENLSAEKYREYLKLLPDIHKENVKVVTMLIFTFAALTFFGIFAINPTLSTIIQLKKQLSDCEFVVSQLTTKINNLSLLQTRYNEMQNDLPALFDAVPQSPKAPIVMGQVMKLATQAGLQLKLLQISEVQLSTKNKSPLVGQSYVFTLETLGDYDAMTLFLAALTHFDRIVTVENTSITKDLKSNALILNVRGRVYFQK